MVRREQFVTTRQFLESARSLDITTIECFYELFDNAFDADATSTLSSLTVPYARQAEVDTESSSHSTVKASTTYLFLAPLVSGALQASRVSEQLLSGSAPTIKNPSVAPPVVRFTTAATYGLRTGVVPSGAELTASWFAR